MISVDLQSRTPTGLVSYPSVQAVLPSIFNIEGKKTKNAHGVCKHGEMAIERKRKKTFSKCF